MTPHYPELGDALLVCATETKQQDDLKQYARNLKRILGRRFEAAGCNLKPTR